jgi:hypothetical protein
MKISDLIKDSFVPTELSILFNDTFDEEIQEKFIEHINSHKYYLNQEYNFEIDFSKAFGSWVEYIYIPTIVSLIKSKLINGYDDDRIGWLFFDIQDDWNDLKEEFPNKNITIKNAVDYFYVKEFEDNEYTFCYRPRADVETKHFSYLFKIMKLKILKII